jgi:hypothetical protein
MVLLTSKLEVQETAVLNNLSRFSPFFLFKGEWFLMATKIMKRKQGKRLYLQFAFLTKIPFHQEQEDGKLFSQNGQQIPGYHLVVLGGKVCETVKCEYVNSFLQQIAYLVL